MTFLPRRTSSPTPFAIHSDCRLQLRWTALLFVLSGVVVWEAIKRLLSDETHVVQATVAAFAVIAISVVVDFFRARLLYRVASKTASEALEADALHFSSDMWSSLAVLVG